MSVYDERFARVWDRFDAQERVQAKADQVFEDYRTSANEFRGVLSDQASRLLPREEYDTKHSMLLDKIISLEARVLQNTAIQSGRSSGISSIGYIVVSIIGGLVGVATVISTLVTLLHTPNPAVETQVKLDRLIEQLQLNDLHRVPRIPQ